MQDNNNSEHKIQNDIRVALSGKDGFVIRCNSGVFKTLDGRVVTIGVDGMADLLYIGAGGVTVWIEVKTARGKQRDAQKAFERRITELGHHYCLARSVEEAKEYVWQSTKNRLNRI